MPPLFEVKPVDRELYASRLRDFLPEDILDVHVHLYRQGMRTPAADPARCVTWPARVAAENPREDLEETYRLLLPGKRVTPLVFGTVMCPADADPQNAYVAETARAAGWPALLFALPEWTAGELRERLAAGGFCGVKVYLSLAPAWIPSAEIRVFDFLPHEHLAALDRLGAIVMLHLPRPARLRDPVNLANLLEIERRYPNVKLIVAHVGRAYAEEDVGDAFGVLAETKRMRFDISANTNEVVFRRLLDAVGPGRVMFGSDLPITRMRMRRVVENGRYVNIVPRGLYGDVSGDPNMRETDGEDAERLSFFLYEELDAFRRAADAAGISRDDIARVLGGNAREWIAAATPRPKPAQFRMVWDPARPVPETPIPAGYRLRTFRPGDEGAYVKLLRKAGFTDWSEVQRDEVLRTALPDGLFFIEHGAAGTLVATAAAQHGPIPHFPFGGVLGWVGTDPAHGGKGLGTAVTAAVMRRLAAAGYRNIHLLTDDFRLPAIRVYLRLGWTPDLFAPDMEPRWRAVCVKLGVDFAGLPCVRRGGFGS
ncbi:MAG: GNAT family N-acetyltransferase [Planctomycetota bacterium]